MDALRWVQNKKGKNDGQEKCYELKNKGLKKSTKSESRF